MASLHQDKLPSRRISEMKSGVVHKRRMRWATYAVGVGFLLAALGQARVNVVDRQDILSKGEETSRFMISRTEYAKRGSVLSADGKPLAQDVDIRELTVNFDKVPKSDSFAMDLSAATGIPASEFRALARSGVKTKVWREPIGAESAKRVQRVKSKWRADGVSLARAGKRSYPLGSAAAGFLGSVRDGQAVNGLELSQNKVLQGVNGLTKGLIDRRGGFLPTRISESSQRRTDGKNLSLTIDTELQMVAAAAVKHAVEINKAIQGSAIVMDPKTGDILAMANWPSYDPNDAWGPERVGDRSPDFNSAYMAALEPGSTFKILTLAKGLEMGVIKPTDAFVCVGTTKVRNRVMGCALHGGTRAHGRLNPELAIAKSCNVWASKWALAIGHDNFVDYMKQLGLLEKTNLGLPQEGIPQFNSDEYAKDLQLATLGFGQSVGTTPVALCGAFSMLANNGVRMKPRLVRAVGDQQIVPMEGARVVSAETAQLVMKYMESVIQSDGGTGHSLRIPGYRLGGKTGTAEKVNKGTQGKYVSNFVGFVPADRPRAVVLVMIDTPTAGAYYGGAVAGPPFVQIARAVIRRFAIPPSSQSTRVPSVQ